MNNPWTKHTQRAPFVLRSDAAIVDAFNRQYQDRPHWLVQTQLLPEPFIGDPAAAVYVLGLNPGYAEGVDDRWHRKAKFRAAVSANLHHRATPFPFYFLSPEFADSPGATWWSRKCRWLIDSFDAEFISRKMFCVESFPYHSKRFHPIPKSIAADQRVPSMAYSVYLVRQAIARSKPIVAMRALKRWCRLVPELGRYRHLYRLRSPQNVVLSPKNLIGYKKLTAVLSAVA